MSKMRFGIFLAPFHAPTGQNPTLALERDVATIKLLDELDYDEAWIGEHHSCGVELIAEPARPTLEKVEEIPVGQAQLSEAK